MLLAGEHKQGLTNEYGDIDTVCQRMEQRFLKAYSKAVATAKDIDTNSVRNGTWANAPRKISKAIKLPGWV
jgi:hypothetical protein